MARLGRFARELKRLRVAKGYRQREWGPLLGVHWVTAQRWEKGHYHPWPVDDTLAGNRMKRAVEDAILGEARKIPDHPLRAERHSKDSGGKR